MVARKSFLYAVLRGEAQWQPGVGQGNGKCLLANFLTRLPAAIGALLAIATIPLHMLISKTQAEQFSAVLLAAIGAIYVGFGLQTGNCARTVTD